MSKAEFAKYNNYGTSQRADWSQTRVKFSFSNFFSLSTL